MTTIGKLWHIARPPLAETYDLPDRRDLLTLKAGDTVKLIFRTEEGGERMWIQLSKTDDIDEWYGTLDNAPMDIADLGLGDQVGPFHPLDIIAIYRTDK